jgi:hypothetical protein
MSVFEWEAQHPHVPDRIGRWVGYAASDWTLLEYSSQRAGHTYEQEHSSARHHAVSLRPSGEAGSQNRTDASRSVQSYKKRAPTLVRRPFSITLQSAIARLR